MLVIPPGLSEEEEALQKKFNKLKKKVRGVAGRRGVARSGRSVLSAGPAAAALPRGFHPAAGAPQCGFPGPMVSLMPLTYPK